MLNPVASYSVSKICPIPAFNAIAIQFKFLPYSDARFTYYECTFLHHDMEFQEERDVDHDLAIEVTPGHIMYLQRPSYTQTPTQVACGCADFNWTFAVAVDAVDSGAANVAYYPSYGYRRVTLAPPIGRPFKNPTGTPTLCKHLFRAARACSTRGWFRP